VLPLPRWVISCGLLLDCLAAEIAGQLKSVGSLGFCGVTHVHSWSLSIRTATVAKKNEFDLHRAIARLLKCLLLNGRWIVPSTTNFQGVNSMPMKLLRLFAIALFVTFPLASQAAAPVPTPTKQDNPMTAARKALDEVGDVIYQARSLQDVINDLKEKAKVAIILDNSIYQFGLDPNQPTVNVNLKQVKMREGLKNILAPYNLKFGLTAEGLFISTEDGVITRQLRQRVNVDCDSTVFGAAVKQLANETGANVVVDPRLGEKANKQVTLKLEDVPLETAIRLLSEVADLRAVRMSNVLFVTTSEKADKLRPDADGPTAPSPINPLFPGGVPQGVIGGFGGVGGIVFPAPVPAACPVPPQPANPAPEAPAPTPDKPAPTPDKPADRKVDPTPPPIEKKEPEKKPEPTPPPAGKKTEPTPPPAEKKP
jgi:hypothetical protein